MLPTPAKFNMEPEKGGFQRGIQGSDFQFPCQNFKGVV